METKKERLEFEPEKWKSGVFLEGKSREAHRGMKEGRGRAAKQESRAEKNRETRRGEEE